MSAPVLRYATVCTVDNDPLKTILRLAHANAGILLWQAEADALKAYLSNDCPEDDTVFCSSLYYDAALQELAVTPYAEKPCGRYVVDNRCASSFLCLPLVHGASIVFEDLAQYTGERLHAPLVLACCKSGRDAEYLEGCLERMNVSIAGEPDLSAEDIHLLCMGLRSFALRMQRRCDVAYALASYGSKHPLIEHVSYPGLPDDAYNAFAQHTLEHGYGPLVVFKLAHELAKSDAASEDTGFEILSQKPYEGVSDITHAQYFSATKTLVITAGVEDVLDIVDALEKIL